jgi:hypothetical protein
MEEVPAPKSVNKNHLTMEEVPAPKSVNKNHLTMEEVKKQMSSMKYIRILDNQQIHNNQFAAFVEK